MDGTLAKTRELVSDRPRGSRDETGRRARGRMSRRLLAATVALPLGILAIGGGYLYWDYASHFETTDDAFIAARQFGIAPQVSGYIVSVPVTDNEHVAAGQVIAQIDPRDYQAALEQAEAQVAAAQAGIGNINAQIAVQQAQVAAAQAQIAQAQASLTYDQQQQVRYADLARTGAGTVQSEQQWASQLRQQQATLKAAQASEVAAVRQLAALKAQRDTAEANLKQAMAQRDQAQLNLSYTTVKAAQPGWVVQLSAGAGEYVSAGTDLSMFVPDDRWVAANFKETQLDHMRPGEKATINIDAYSDRTIHGHVASVQPGSGTAFSLLPAQNATGNWVKIVQRVPVKIVMDDLPKDVALGPGMSVEATVRVNPNPPLIDRLESWL
jgi:membrane fusion protein, multidrug efflux system